MKVLLLGEYSGLHNHLSCIMRSAGIECTLVSTKNAFRDLPSDVPLDSPLRGFVGKLHTALMPLLKVHKLMNYDVVQAISSKQFHPFINDFFLDVISKNSVSFFSLHTGCDYNLHEYYKSNIPDLCFDCLKYDQRSPRCSEASLNAVKSQKHLYEMSKAIIPMGSEYRAALINGPFSNKTLDVHPLPFRSPFVKYKEISPSKVLRVFHGLNRYGFKSTRLVEKAIEIIYSQKVPNIEIVIPNRTSYNQFVSSLGDYDVCIDQLYSHNYGYGALLPMSLGVPVISSVSKIALSALNTNLNPFIYSAPSADELVEKLIFIQKNRDILFEKQNIGFQFLQDVHSECTVVRKFLNSWSV